MRVVTWNVRRASASSAAWQYLLDIAPDIALLQEAGVLPAEVGQAYQCHAEAAVRRDGKPQAFSTMILVRGGLGLNHHRLNGTAGWVNAELARFGGNLVAGEVTPESGHPIRVVSVYSPAWPVDRTRLAGTDVSAVKLTQNPDVWVADLLCDALRNQDLSRPWIVAGDFNASETFDSWPGGPRGNREYLDRMADLGLVECLRASHGKLTPTYQNTDKVTVRHQIDHLFVSESLAGNLLLCCTGPQSIVFGGRLSDHLPVIADFVNGGTNRVSNRDNVVREMPPP